MTKRAIKSKKRIAHSPLLPPERNAADELTLEEFALISDWHDRQRQWKADVAAAPYDGILGSLPSWLPHGINSEFATTCSGAA